jgi:diaminopimelate decarboxylase
MGRLYKKTRVYYAAKANSNLSILRILESEGAFMDVVSLGEVFLALQSGFQPERILFTGTSVRNDELKFLADSDIAINVDSLSQLKRLLKITVPKVLSVRVNPELGAGHHDHCITAGKNTKFGLWEGNALKAYEKAKQAGVKRFGIHMHIGSGVMNADPFLLALKKLLNVARKVHDNIGINFEFVDMGGGLGVPHKPGEKPLNLETFSEKVLSEFRNKIEVYDLGEPYFCVEPGRYLVSDSGILLTKVNTVKITPFKKFVGVDAGFNTLARPMMYDSYHHILVANKLDFDEIESYDVVGPICESGDVMARARILPSIDEGDLLAILNAGAYGYSMSSQYNARPRAAEVLVNNGTCKLIRDRERFEDLISK